MKQVLFFVAFAFTFTLGCESPNRISLEALSDSWSALRPYTEAGIDGAAEITEEAKAELKAEVEEFTKTLAEELSHAK